MRFFRYICLHALASGLESLSRYVGRAEPLPVALLGLPEATTNKPETAYFVTSLPPHKCAPLYLLQIVRGYWGAVENGVHWVRDAVLREDACRVRKGALPRVLAALTNMTLTILRLAGVRDLKRTMRSFYRKGSRAP